MLEVTLRTECALEAIRAIAKEVPDAIVGAGTVTNVEQLKAVTEAGARSSLSARVLPNPAESGDRRRHHPADPRDQHGI